ncbi:glutathione S-transferase family protein [Panacagrimonas sp.]|uniref:glutathione S-transferase family protein n=1 Tax=Panacagrimonas sp. TaxID=2480088 RepID=UPI003B51F8E9
MKLYCSATSPYARKVRVVAHELGLSDLIDEIECDPFEAPPELLAANPLSRIPTLVTERGEALPDSTLVIEYLQTRGRGLTALPRGSKRWSALRRAHVAEGVINAAFATVIEKRRPEGIRHVAFLDRQADVIRRSIAVLDLEAAELTHEPPSVVEITVGVALSYLDLRMPYIEWRKGHEPLERWYTVFAERPSMVATQPPA